MGVIKQLYTFTNATCSCLTAALVNASVEFQRIVISKMASSLNEKLQGNNFLEGESEYAREIQKYSSNLSSKNLPVIFTREHLSLIMGFKPTAIKDILDLHKKKYTPFKVRKKTGGHRWIMAPDNDLKYMQNWIRINMLNKIPIHPSATGFLLSTSIVKNAESHLKKEVVLNIDLYRFFESITSKRVYGILKSMGYHPNLSYDIAKILCVEPPAKYWTEVIHENKFRKNHLLETKFILPQGSPASPVISNIICYKLDKRLSSLGKKLNCSYTRYADDITFSGDRENIPSLKTIKKIIRNEGFYINNDKIKYFNSYRRQEVTGIVVNQKLKVKREFLTEIKRHLYFSEKFGPRNHQAFLESKGIPIKDNFKQWLLGKISFVNGIEPQTGKFLYEKFNSITWDL